MTKWLNNIWPANQVAEYMKETTIQRAQWIRQNGAKTVEIRVEQRRLHALQLQEVVVVVWAVGVDEDVDVRTIAPLDRHQGVNPVVVGGDEWGAVIGAGGRGLTDDSDVGVLGHVNGSDRAANGSWQIVG
ncbi:unnamed protein product [Coregonus sp. 'balchen']|nr:unnamed protein product [Coregonus sp. 'balchen']